MWKRVILGVAGMAFAAALAVFVYENLGPSETCEVCYRPMHEETFYRIHLADGDSMDVCCPRCGLRFQEGRNDVVGAEVTDFSTGKRLEAETAIYVEHSAVHFCSHAPVQEDRSGAQYELAWDRCLPSLIAFDSETAARSFQAKNGGGLKTYRELLEEVSP